MKICWNLAAASLVWFGLHLLPVRMELGGGQGHDFLLLLKLA
jgi:hypothetical protein